MNKSNIFSSISNLKDKLNIKVKENFEKIFGEKNKEKYEKIDNEKKQIFTIHEDEDNKVYNYNLDEDDDDYNIEEVDHELENDLGDGKEEEKRIKSLDVDNNKNSSSSISNIDYNYILKSTNKTSSNCFSQDEQFSIDRHTISHRIFIKESIIDLDGLTTYVKCYKMKKKNKLFSLLGAKISLSQLNYIILIDENFIYMIKDIIYDDKNILLRKVGKYHNLRYLTNVDIKKLEIGEILIRLVFTINNDIENFKSKIKEIYFEKDYAIIFLNHIKNFLKNYKISVFINDIALTN